MEGYEWLREYYWSLLDRLIALPWRFRFITEGTMEPGLWIANAGYDLRGRERGKFSFTLSPIIGLSALSVTTTTIRLYPSYADPLAYAVSYTWKGLPYGVTDAVTNDGLYAPEMELAIYLEPPDESKPSVELVSIAGVADLRLDRGASYSPPTLRAQKALAKFLGMGRIYSRLRTSYLPPGETARLAALLILAEEENPVLFLMAAAWDEYFEDCPYDICLNAEPRPDAFVELAERAMEDADPSSLADTVSPDSMAVKCMEHLGLPAEWCTRNRGRLSREATRIVENTYGLDLELDSYTVTSHGPTRVAGVWDELLREPEIRRLWLRASGKLSPAEVRAWLKLMPDDSLEAFDRWVEQVARARAGPRIGPDEDPEVQPEDQGIISI